MKSFQEKHPSSIVLTEMQLQAFFTKIAQLTGEELDSEALFCVLLDSVEEVKRFHDAWEKEEKAPQGRSGVIAHMGIEYQYKDSSGKGAMN